MKSIKHLSLLSLFCLISLGNATAQAQTPNDVWQKLMAGNTRFLTNTQIRHDYKGQKAANEAKQRPEVIIIGCMDSRFMPELALDLGIGEAFTIGVAGPVINSDVIA